MKKYLICLLFIFLFPMSIYADHIYDIKMDVVINKDGSLSMTEIWDVKASGGSEWYKSLYNLDNVEVSNFKVMMDDVELKEKKWNINESLKEKKGYYGINYVDEGIELCFGKSDMKRHKFTLTYLLSNVIINLDDAQALQWTFLPDAASGLDDFDITISSFYEFPDDLDVWGYGYKGLAYVDGGKIYATNDGYDDNNYVKLLAKFPLDTFDTDNRLDRYNTFDELLQSANVGTFSYDYDDDNTSSFIDDLFSFIGYALFFLIFGIIGASVVSSGYGYAFNKKIDKKNTPMFRDIPCNKDIMYANALIKLNNFDYKETNILGAIILKWVRNDKIKFITEKGGLFNNKEKCVIDLTLNPVFDDPNEKKLFDMMYEASKDGLLQTKEFEVWCKKNYSKFFKFFNNLVSDEVKKLEDDKHIYKRTNKKECKKKNVMDDAIYNDSSQLYGLKLYLNEFSNMNSKEVMEVKLWDEYLMFAYLFGIADKVAKQLKNLYPEIMMQEDTNYYDTIRFVNYVSSSSYKSASSARSAAQSYSGGGGGFSSGGGGGGFSGGGGSFGGR